MELLTQAAHGLHPEQSKFLLRRISVIKDKEGKNRPIAVFDYWSQTCLKSLHDSLFKSFRSIKTDLTFNQDAKAVYDPTNPNAVYHSFDLSAATDRFPVSLQEQVLAELIGPEKASA